MLYRSFHGVQDMMILSKTENLIWTDCLAIHDFLRLSDPGEVYKKVPCFVQASVDAAGVCRAPPKFEPGRAGNPAAARRLCLPLGHDLVCKSTIAAPAWLDKQIEQLHLLHHLSAHPVLSCHTNGVKPQTGYLPSCGHYVSFVGHMNTTVRVESIPPHLQ